MKKLAFTAWTLLLAAGLAAGQGKIKLGLHLEEGHTYGLRMVQEQAVSQTYMGQQQEIKQRLGVAYTFEVDRYLEDRTIWMTATYRDLKLRIESPAEVAEYDSQLPLEEASALMTGFAALNGQSIRLQVSPIGQILRIEGVDLILKRMMEAYEMPEGPARRELEERIQAQFGKEALLESFGNIMAIYPEAPVSEGDSWTRRLPSNQGIPMVFQNTWTLRQSRDGVARLDLVSEVTPNLEGQAVEMAGMKLRYDMTGRQQGSIELEESSGWILGGSMTLDFQGSVQVEGAGMEWPMSVKSTLRFEPYEAPGDSRQAAKGAKFDPLDSPAGSGSAQPNLTADRDGRVYLSWQQPQGEKETALRFSVWDGSAWSAARTIAQGSGWFVNWADFPSMAALPDGSLAAHWLVKSASATYAYDVHISRSMDGGQSWQESVVPHRDGTSTEHGFVSLFSEDEGLLGAVWLDGRQMAGEAGGNRGHGRQGSMTLRYAALTPGGELRDEALLDERVCECCQTSAARTSDGVVVAYRDRSEDEVRDIYTVVRRQGRWSAPRPVSRDNWAINGCPVNGPSVSAQGQQVAVAWFSQPDEDPQVQLAFSSDGAESFGPAIRIDSGQPIGRVDLALLEDGSALVSRLEWEEGEDEPAILVRRAFPDGRLQDDLLIASSGAARSTGFSQMIRSGSQIFFAWTDASRPSHVRTARLLF